MKKYLRVIILLILVSGSWIACENEPRKEKAPEPVSAGEETPPDTPDVVFDVDPVAIGKQLKRRSGLRQDSLVQQFYQQHEQRSAWGAPEDRADLLQALESAPAEGLFPSDYHLDKIRELTLREDDLEQSEIALLDILLTDAFFGYAHDLYFGKLNPEDLYPNWGVARKEKDLPGLLKQHLEKGSISLALERLKPPHQIYRDLKKSLQEYAQLKEKEEDFPKIPGGKLLRPGDQDPRISAIAERLRELGYYTGPEIDSSYTDALQQAVRALQGAKGLQVDGIIGNSTIELLNMSATKRYQQILANLERWRWYPRDLGEHYILINIPQFKLAVVKSGDTVRTHNIIAGTRSRQTPIFTDTLQYIVINPKWIIPPTIRSQDIIPQASRDSTYLARQNMMVLGPDGTALDPATIDWSDPVVYDYTYIQRPGPTNPLGRVKIIYPNRYLVYLHDTPAQSLFSQNQRAESSGCVRVENAVDLSAYVLQEQEEWSEEKIREYIAQGKTTQIEINQPIQVHHFYWTTWRAGGQAVFTEDVYGLDKGISSRLVQQD